MRTLMSGSFHEWRARAGELWTGLNGRAAWHFDLPASDQATTLAAHAFAAVVVAGAFLLQWTLGRAAGEPHFWLFHVAVALTAGGTVERPQRSSRSFSRCCWLACRSAVPMSTAVLFGIEGLLIGLVVLRMGTVIQALRRSLEGSELRIRIS